MKVLFIDCFAGISGDMFLSALLDAGLDRNELLDKLNLLDLGGYDFRIIPAKSYGLAGTRVEIKVKENQPRRHLRDIERIIKESTLSDGIKKAALKIFDNLARAEAKVHGTSVDKIHFHEVGAVDSILDVVGAAIAIHILQPDKIYCNTLPVGGGYIKCEHGTLPVPAPATAELIKGLPVRWGPVDGELVTPTGAAIVKTLVNDFKVPEMRVEKIGYGIGSNDLGIPNALRVMLGTSEFNLPGIREEIDVLECNIDDMNPELVPYLQETLLKAGALDVYIQNVIMKKGRWGIQVKVLCPPGKDRELINILFKESTTLGVRYRRESRIVARRKVIKLPTPYGDINIKIATLGDGSRPVQCAPEFEDCKKAAKRYNVPLKEVYRTALIEAENFLKNN